MRWTDPNGVEHECTTSACFGSGTGGCPPGQKQCPDGSCVPLDGCCSDADCPSGRCVNGICVPDTCTNDSDCPPGYHCDNGVCVPDTCTSDTDCPPGYRCVNGTCEPSSYGLYYIDNVQWSLDNFCTSGFSVSGTLRDSSGAKASGRVRIEVNGKQLGEINVNGDFTVGFNKSQYADVLGCSNTITLTAISSSGVVGRSVSTTKDCPCNCSYSVSCTVSSAQVNDGGSVTFSGQLSSTNCGVGTQPVKIYDNGTLVATATTDSQGRWSATLTLSGAGTHTLKAEAPDGSTCTQSVTVQQKGRTVKIETSYTNSILNKFEIKITELQDAGEVVRYSRTWWGTSGYTLADRLEPQGVTDPQSGDYFPWDPYVKTWIALNDCYDSTGRRIFRGVCARTWEVNMDIQNEIRDKLKYLSDEFSFTDEQIDQIITEVNHQVDQILRAHISDKKWCDPPCCDCPSETRDTSTGPGKYYYMSKTIQV